MSDVEHRFLPVKNNQTIKTRSKRVGRVLKNASKWK